MDHRFLATVVRSPLPNHARQRARGSRTWDGEGAGFGVTFSAKSTRGGRTSDGAGANNTQSDPPTVDFMLLTGDPAWADVSIQSRVYSDGQNTGSWGIILRASPKTKVTDPDTWYEFAILTNGTTDSGDVSGDVTTPTAEGITHDQADSGIQNITVTPTLRIYKVVKNKWTVLAETDFHKSKVHIPEVNQVGYDHDTTHDGNGTPTGATFRFVAKGNVLQGFASVDGVTFNKYLEVTDNDLTAGKVGFTHCKYNPVFHCHDLLVQDAP